MAKLKKGKGVVSYNNAYTGSSSSFSTSSNQGGGNNAPFMGGMGQDFFGQSHHDRVQYVNRDGIRFSTGRVAQYRGVTVRTMTDARGRTISNTPTVVIGK